MADVWQKMIAQKQQAEALDGLIEKKIKAALKPILARLDRLEGKKTAKKKRAKP